MILLIVALLGGLSYRLRGGLIPGTPKILSRLIFTIPFAVVSWMAIKWWSLPATAITYGAIVTGHGRWQSYKEPLKGNPEATEYPIQWLISLLPTYWYKFTGMAYNGLLITLPAGLATLNPFIALSGISKAIAYSIGWKIYPKQYGKGISGFNQATQIGEFLTGAFMWGALWAFR